MKRARVISLMVAVSVLIGEVALIPSQPVSAGPAPTVEAPVAPASVPVSSEPPAAGKSTAGTPYASAVRAPVNLSTPTETSSQPNAGPDSDMVPAPGMPAARTLTGFDAKTSVEELDLRTQFSKTYRNVDGTETLVQSSAPVHYRTSSGSWADVDNRVVRDGLGRLTNAANDWSVTFEPMTSGKGVGITTADGNVRFVGEGAAAVTPTVEPDGESVRYPNVYPGMDIVYRVTGGGVEELLVLKQPTATPAVSFRFDGLNLDMAPGQLKGRGTSKLAKRLTVSAPETFDSTGKPVDVAQQVFTVADITTGSSRVKVGMSGTAVAATPVAKFPLTVDPNVSLTPSTMTAYANYTNNGTSYATYSDGYARVGNPYLSSTSTVRWRTALQIDYNLLWNSSITAATLTTNVVDGTTNGARSLKVFWGSQMGFHYSVAPRSYNQTSPPAAAATSGWTKPYLVDTISAGVENLTGSNLKFLYNNFTRLNVPITSGTLLLQGDETAAYTMKKFTVSLSLTFNRWPATPTATVSTGKRPLVFGPASGTDPDSDALQFRYRYWDDVNANGVVDTYESGWTAWGTGAGNTSVALPAAWTGDQIHTYVDSWDGILFAGEYHVSTKEFALQTVVNTAPPIPSLVSPLTGTQQHPLTVSLTAATVADANTDALTYTFFSCTDATCSTGRTYFTGAPIVIGSQVSQSVTFTASFAGQQIFWGVEVSDSVAGVRSATRSITFTNTRPSLLGGSRSPSNNSNLDLTPPGSTSNPLPVLTAVVMDPDDLAVNYQFQIRPIDGSGVLVTSPVGTKTQAVLGGGVAVSYQMPAWLQSYKGYRWDLVLGDVAGMVTSLGDFSLTTHSRRLGLDPAAPMQDIGGMQVNLATGNVVIAAGVGKSVATVGGPLSVGLTYNSQDTSSLGMRGTYYLDSNSNHQLDAGEQQHLVRTDPYPAFDWGNTKPAESVSAAFSAVWEGTVTVPVAGDWAFAVTHDQFASIAASVNGASWQSIYSSGTAVPTSTVDPFTGLATPLTVSPGDIVKLRVDYQHSTGAAFVGLRARLANATDSNLNGEYTLADSWFTSSDNRVLPTGWTLSGDTGADPVWVASRLSTDYLTLIAVDGSTHVWQRKSNNGLTSWAPPAESDDIAIVHTDGTVTVLGSDGLTYEFAVDGHLNEVTTAADDLRPAGAKRVYDPVAGVKLTGLEDRLVPTRAIRLFYNQSGLDSACAAPPTGFDVAAPTGMLCAVTYPDGTSTQLYYQQGLLARISEPGNEATQTVAPAPEGRAVTDFVWTNGQLAEFRSPANSDRVNAQNASPSPIPVGQQIPATELKTRLNWNGTELTVTAPRPNTTDPRPSTTIAFGQSATTVTPAPMTRPARTVQFDTSGRTTVDEDAVGRKTNYTWATSGDFLLKTTAAGRTSTTVYDSQWHPTDTYGPADPACFTTTPPSAENASYPPVAGACANAMPHTRTEYDHNIQGLQAAYTATAGTPLPNTSHTMGPNAQGNVDYTWTGAPTGLTTVDNWTATFTGNIVPTTTGSYAFRLTAGATDTATLYVDDVAMVKVQPGTSDLAAGAMSLTAGTVHRISIAYTAGTGTSILKLGWTPSGGTLTYALGTQLKPGFWYATRTTTDDTTGSTQIPATHVTETRYNDGIDPVYGIAATTIEDPYGLTLTTRETYEPVGANSLLRRTKRTLPAYAANVTQDNSTNYSYYGAGIALANPCVAGSTPVNQAELQQTTTSTKAADGTTITTRTVYDVLGRPVATQYGDDAPNVWTCTTYDARGRVTAVSIPANATTPNGRTITTTYAVAGDPYTTATTDGTGSTLPTTTVDALGRAVTTVDVWGVTTTTTYDQIGRTRNQVTTIANPSYSSTTGYTWDDAGRQTTQTLDGKTIAQLTYGSDTAPLDPGLLETVTYPAAGATTAGNGTKGTFTYDNLGRIAGLAWEGPGGTPITSDTVTRALGGNILTDTIDGTLAWTYTYDSVSRLTRAAGSGHDYQYGFATTTGCAVNTNLNTVTNTAAGANSNRTTLTDNATPVAAYCYDQADRLLATSQAGYTGAINYDTHGNTTLLAGDTSTYDFANRHMSTQHGATLVTYTRDSSDAIVARADTSDASNIRYGDNGLVMTTANAVTERTLTLPGGTLVTQRSSGDIWSNPNIHGDIAATSTSAGVKQGLTVRYDAFGGVSLLPDNSAGNLDFGWAGQFSKGAEHSPGLAAVIEMGSRVYSPQLGRFAAVDPIEGGTPNSYTYPNDPINDSDLNGNICWSCAVRHVANAAKAVVTNPVFQVVATVAACFTPACTAVAAGFAAVNTYSRVQRRGGWSKAVRSGSFWAATALDVATVFVPRVVPVSSVVADESVAAMSRYGRPIKAAAGFLTSRARSWTALTNLVKVSAVGSARYSACRGLRMGC